MVNQTKLDLNSFQKKLVSFTWRPTTSNNHSIELAVVPVIDETITGNNNKVRTIDVRNWKYVLLDRSNGGWSIGNFYDWVQELKKYNFIVKES